MRRLLGAATLALGVWFVGRSLAPVAPRDVEVHVRLSAFRDESNRARSITVAFERDGDAVRAVTERFEGARPPSVWSRTVSIPEGNYATTVTVELPGRSVQRISNVHVAPGGPVDVPPPAAE